MHPAFFYKVDIVECKLAHHLLVTSILKPPRDLNNQSGSNKKFSHRSVPFCVADFNKFCHAAKIIEVSPMNWDVLRKRDTVWGKKTHQTTLG